MEGRAPKGIKHQESNATFTQLVNLFIIKSLSELAYAWLLPASQRRGFAAFLCFISLGK